MIILQLEKRTQFAYSFSTFWLKQYLKYLMESELKPIVCKAAVAYGPKQPMRIEEITVAPPKQGQIRVKVIANALCHTDIYTLDGHDPQGLFPCILGHQATAVVESIGKGVTRVKVGDIVIPCYTPQCMEKQCVFCSHKKSNLCPKIRGTQGKGYMPDGTSRFTNKEGKQIYHFMGCSTFSQYTVIAQISAAKINPKADLNKVCMIGCGISTGWGAVMNNTDVQAGTTVAVWGLGAVGLSVIQAAKIRGASRIYGIDINPKKFQIAKKFGATDCYQPTQEKSAKTYLLEKEKWGIHYTFDCTGNVVVMREALESAHRGFGQSCVIGVAQAGKQIATRSFQLVTGRKWLGTAFGGWKSVEDVPKLVNKTLLGQWPIDQYVTHQFKGIEQVNKSVDALHSGECLRAVVKISEIQTENKKQSIKVTNSIPHFGGVLKTVTHWSECNNCFMSFNIFLPKDQVNQQRGKPYSALYFLSGLCCNHNNTPEKSGFGRYASKHNIAVVFPDTSPRNTNIEGISNDWEMGDSAGYYVDATSEKCKQYFNMFTYITKQLPQVVSSNFHVSKENMSITGFSMGGHGALIASLKTNLYRSVSAFAPMVNPTQSADWGQKAFKLFFNNPEQQGKAYDTTELIKSGNYTKVPTLVDIGSNDQFSHKIVFENFTNVVQKQDFKAEIKIRAGYNHSFYYVSTFLQEHFDFHAKYLNWYA